MAQSNKMSTCQVSVPYLQCGSGHTGLLRICQNSLKLKWVYFTVRKFYLNKSRFLCWGKKTLNNIYPYHSTYACILLFFIFSSLCLFSPPYAFKSLLFSHHLLLIIIPPLQIYPNRKNTSPGIDLLANLNRTPCDKFLNVKRQTNQRILLNTYTYNSFIQQISSSTCVRFFSKHHFHTVVLLVQWLCIKYK